MIDDRRFVRASSIRRALSVLGDVSTLLIIGAAFLRARRFDEFYNITLLQRSILSDRLTRLCDAGVLRKQQYAATSSRHEYRLTRKGVELQPMALLLLAWEAQWDPAPEALYRIQLVHRGCGKQMRAVPRCTHCGKGVKPEAIEMRAGPGEAYVLAQHARQRRPAPTVAEKQMRTVLPGQLNRIIGDRWSALAIASMFEGFHSFDDLARDTGAATNILTDRLRDLADKHLLEHRAAEGGRGEYRLTERGLDLHPLFVAIQGWGDRWFAAPEGPPQLPLHTDCGESLEFDLGCSACGETLELGAVEFRIINTDTGGLLDSWRDATPG